MEIDIEKQKNLLVTLGAIDGQLSGVEVAIENLNKETGMLEADKKRALTECQHVDEEGTPAIAGGTLYAWCQICGKLLSDADIKELETE